MDPKDNEKKKVRYYSNGRFYEGTRDMFDDTERGSHRRPMPAWGKALIIIALVILFSVILMVGCSRMIGSIFSDSEPSQVTTGFGHDYIGVLYVTDTIDEYGSGSYNHQYILSAIDAMMDDGENRGLILYVDTPGGSVYASDELYLKIEEYKSETGRPVYSSMQSQATSGGYYISAGCDKILANRNCWTGSIGVTMGTFVDISQLLSDLGIRTETITSGANKAMGSTTEPMTDEQREIFQSLIDEAYEQFVGIVADGRDMSVSEVKKLADGRIYSAQQAVDNGLVDGIATFEEAVDDMIYTYDLQDVYVEGFQPDTQLGLASLLNIAARQKGSDSLTDTQAIEALIELNGTFRLSYMSSVAK